MNDSKGKGGQATLHRLVYSCPMEYLEASFQYADATACHPMKSPLVFNINLLKYCYSCFYMVNLL